MWKISALLAVVALGLGGLVATTVLTPDRVTESEQRAAWSEVAWPFPIDQWGKGKAFRCNTTSCGAEVNLYVRAKIGFCNCTTGVSDDAELARISDFNLFNKTLSPLGPGREISIAWMKGRSRSFTVGAPATDQSALSIGFNDHCDAIVATAVVGHSDPAKVEQPVIKFLNSRTIIGWAEVALGL